MKKRVICIDFDGTCVTHKYPEIGEEVGATEVLRDLVESGNKLILFTMRSGSLLNEAIQWFDDRGIPLWGINKNPTQWTWTKSPKPHADLYIDDCGCYIPLIEPGSGDRPYVNWRLVREWLVRNKFIQDE